MSQSQIASQKDIFRFWLPLASTWLMMAMEGPYLAAIIARMDEPKINLAAYGVAFSFGLLAEAPVIMLMSAATALATDRVAYLKFRKFSFLLSVIVTVTLLIGLIPAVFDTVILDLMALPADLGKLIYLGLWSLIPWPAAIGVRRFYQGVLIRHGSTKSVAVATLGRLVFMSVCAVVFVLFTDFSGTVVGTLSLSFGVIAEAAFVRILAQKTITKVLSIEPKQPNPTTASYRNILKFYYPLALTALIGLAALPIVTFFAARAANPIESLAVIPVINAFVFIFRAIGLSYQEVSITFLARTKENYPAIKSFAVKMGLLSSALFVLVAFTPLANFWLETLAGLSSTLAVFALFPLQIQVLLPPFVIILNWQRGLLVFKKKTLPITIATGIDLGLMTLILGILSTYSDLNGAIIASIGIVISRMASCGYLAFHCP